MPMSSESLTSTPELLSLYLVMAVLEGVRQTVARLLVCGLCGHLHGDHGEDRCEARVASLSWGRPDERCWCEGFEAGREVEFV